MCGDVCVDTASDPAHCGACGGACVAPPNAVPVCSVGACAFVCASGFVRCGDACVDLNSDAAHCGACGNACEGPEGGTSACVAGSCAPACPAGTERCGDACVDTATDKDHCGTCSNACVDPLGGTATCAGGTCAPACPNDGAICDGICRDTDSDEVHCGGCGRVCDAPVGGTAVCEAGNCVEVCPEGEELCDGVCREIANDPSHCGQCGRVCEAPISGVAQCVSSECVQICSRGTALCDGACVDTTTDEAHCGSCDQACTAPVGGTVSCMGSECVPSCPQGQELCDGVCRDLAIDPTNCGTCGRTCETPPGGAPVCIAGECKPACPAGKTLCGDACLDLAKDPLHCGACETACAAVEGGTPSCTGGRCGFTCGAGLTACGEACVNVVNDVENCGACNAACVAPPGGSVSCSNRACVPSCAAPLALCDGACVDRSTDEANCGTCGHDCPASTVCTNGVCQSPPPEIVALDRTTGHARLDTAIWIRGRNFHGSTSARLVRGTQSVALEGILTGTERLRATVPAETAVGVWDVEVSAAGGSARLANAFTITAEPLRIEQLEVGQGDAAIIRGPTGLTMLVDGSIPGMGLNRVNPRLGGAPDYIVVSHFDADHLSGVWEVLSGPDGVAGTADDRVPKIALLDHGNNYSCSTNLCRNYLDYRRVLAAQGKARALVPGERIDLGAGASALALVSNGETTDGFVYTGDENGNSTGVVIEFGGFRYYMGGDITGGPLAGCAAAAGLGDVESLVAYGMGRVDALKVSHHGSCTSSPPALVGIAQPSVALVSVGRDNTYCHPARRVLNQFDRVGADILMTNPGVVTPANASGCPLTELSPAVQRTYGNLALEVPGDGTFISRVGEGAFSRTYTVNVPRVEDTHPIGEWLIEHGARLVGASTARSVIAPIDVELAAVPSQTVAVLVPWQLADDVAIAAAEAGTVAGAIPATVTRTDRTLRIAPASALAPKSDYAVIVPKRASGTASAIVVPFTTGRPVDTTLPVPTLQSLPQGPAGVLLDTRRIVLDFNEVLQGVANANVYLEETTGSLDGVRGTITQGNGGKSVTFELPQSSRPGPNNTTCAGLCPNLTYAVRFTGAVTDESGNYVDAARVPTFTTGACADAGPPTAGTATAEAFRRALSVYLRADEPLKGELRVAPASSFSTACDATPTSACRRIPLVTGPCAANPCQPQSNACSFFGVVDNLVDGTNYRWQVTATDLVDKPVATQTGTIVSGAAAIRPVITEVHADALAATEREGEFVEVYNAGTTAIDLTTLRLGRFDPATGAISGIVTLGVFGTSPSTIPAREVGLIVGAGFLPTSHALPASTVIVQNRSLSTGNPLLSILSSGLANDPVPAVALLDAAGNPLSVYRGGDRCAAGVSATRIEHEAPDVESAFSCVAASPGVSLE